MARALLVPWAAVALLLALGGAAGAGSGLDVLRQRAQAGDPLAQNELGVRHVEGSGVPRDDAAAVEWFRRAAEQGYVEAQYNLSVMYANGQGVRQDDAETVAWSRRAAAQGHAGAQYGLGLLYAVGAGVPQDYVQAHLWFSLAMAGLTGEEREMAEVDRGLVEAKMTPIQLAEAQRLAREWQPRHTLAPGSGDSEGADLVTSR